MSELALQLNDSLDLKLAVAGPGARAYAFMIDFKIRLLAALLWLGIGMTIFNYLGQENFTDLTKEAQRPYLITVVIPTLIIYFLYHPIFELSWHGRTPGKLLAGVRVVNLAGQVPSPMQILVRNFFRLIDSLPAMYALGLVMCFFGQTRARIGDLAAGTLLVHDGLRANPLRIQLKRRARSELTDAQWDFAANLVERWSGLMPARREALAQQFFAHLGVKPPHGQPYSELAMLKQLLGVENA